ncbi:MAG: N-acetylmuramoyl-L-alanine amidase [Firmicutes bacterium]|nr:N-acetylmuramoyl-L-alanine amidase [Bacillota bacterium]
MTEYNKTKQELNLHKVTTILTIACIVLVFCATGLNLYAGYLRHSQTGTTAVAVISFTQDGQPLSQYYVSTEALFVTHTPVRPIIALCGYSGIFYDPITDIITLPYGVTVASTWHNSAYYIHEITLEGVHLLRRNRLFWAYSDLLINIRQEGDTLNIRTQDSAALRYCTEGGYIQFVNLRDIYHTIVVIDPGHGGLDTGADNVLGRNAPKESEVVLAISQKLLDIFDEPGILLVPTRTEDVSVNNGDRYSLANRIGDYFVSIHANACDISRSSGGTLTLYGQAPGSAELAYAFQSALVNALGSRDRGTEFSTGFRILNGSNVPVVLLELLFLSNPTEAERLGDSHTQMLIARTIADVIKGLGEN